MTTPRATLTSDDMPPGLLSEDDLRRGWNQQADERNQWESLDSAEQLEWAQAQAIAADRARAALRAEPGGESPRPDGDWFTVAPVAQDMRSRGLAEQVAGEELLKLATSKRLQPGRPATPPAPESPGEALASRPLLEKVARLDNSIGITVAEVRQLAGQAAAWLRSNPPGQPVAIEPRGCPAPGACSCVVLASDRARRIAREVGPVGECPNCGYEGEMAPAPQAGDVGP